MTDTKPTQNSASNSRVPHRMDRRMAILRGKRQTPFDRDQYAYEEAIRERTARKIRAHLRRMQPVTLLTPRWSSAQRFLDDISIDLACSTPKVVSRTLSLAPLEGRTAHQAWAWLVQAMTEFCGFALEGPAWQVVSRRGFQSVMKDLFNRAEELDERRCLMIHGLEHIQVEALRDLIVSFQKHTKKRIKPPMFNLLLAGSIDAPHFEFDGLQRIALTDFSRKEAVMALVEDLGTETPARLRSVVDIVGGIPGMLEALTDADDKSISRVIADSDHLWHSLGRIGQEIQTAMHTVRNDDALSNRLDHLARTPHGLAHDMKTDAELVRSGLARVAGVRGQEITTLRSPVFAELT